jgi:NAD(P)-dependent dehydrogenase (short-subunit alcohol dehydrogenase family)
VGWLDGKVGLMVGGGSGIGRAVVDAFVAEGAAVGVLELDEAKCAEVAGAGGPVRAVYGDATSPDDCRRAVETTVAAFGRLDALAVFVGIFDYYRPLREIPGTCLQEAFWEVFTVNVLSSLAAAQAAIEPLSRAGGTITLTLSTSSFHPGRGGPLYVASKFALRGLVTQLGHELAPDIRVNGVAPGGTLATDLRGARSLGLQDRRLGATPGREAQLRSRTPLQVALAPADHAGAYLFLASDRARGITGEVIGSDGGVGVRG